MNRDIAFVQSYLDELQDKMVVGVQRLDFLWHQPLQITLQESFPRTDDADEWHLRLLESLWRLETPTKFLSGSLDILDNEEKVEQTIQQLVQKKLLSIQVEDYTFSLKLEFSDGFYLHTIPTTSLKVIFWSIMTPHKRLSVGSNQLIRIKAIEKSS